MHVCKVCICVYMCICGMLVHVYAQMHLHIYTWLWNLKSDVSCLPQWISTLFMWQGSLAQNSLFGLLVWLSSMIPSLLQFWGEGVAAWPRNFLCGFWGSELWSSCLHCNCVFQLVNCLLVLLAFWKMTTIDIQIKISKAIPSKQNLLKGLNRTHPYEISVPQG